MNRAWVPGSGVRWAPQGTAVFGPLLAHETALGVVCAPARKGGATTVNRGIGLIGGSGALCLIVSEPDSSAKWFRVGRLDEGRPGVAGRPVKK